MIKHNREDPWDCNFSHHFRDSLLLVMLLIPPNDSSIHWSRNDSKFNLKIKCILCFSVNHCIPPHHHSLPHSQLKSDTKNNPTSSSSEMFTTKSFTLHLHHHLINSVTLSLLFLLLLSFLTTNTGQIVTDRITGQIISTQCFAERLSRCQQNAKNIIAQIPADFLPPSSVTSDTYTNPSFRYIYQDLPNKCSIIRQDLDCLLTYTIGCINSPVSINGPNPYGPNPASSSHPNEIYKSKQFLDKFCDHKGGWRTTQCFNKPDLRNCEASLTTLSSGQPCQ